MTIQPLQTVMLYPAVAEKAHRAVQAQFPDRLAEAAKERQTKINAYRQAAAASGRLDMRI